MINLFIDTNIYLNFYHFSNETLDKLSDLQKLINTTKEINLFVPSHLVDEFKRNREAKIKDALKKFEDSNLKINFPRMCSDYGEVKEIRALISRVTSLKKELMDKLNTEIMSNSLKADSIINNLFTKSIGINSEIIEKAKLRFQLGNPPGKNRSYGDAINWEFLLSNVPDKEDVYFVSGDVDYASPLDDNLFSQYLLEDWFSKKGSELFFYKSLNDFFKAKYPDIQLIDDYIKDSLINDLEKSRSFDNARYNIRRLLELDGFSESQINKIVKSSIANPQIYNANIYSPETVGKRLERIISGYEDKLEPENYKDFCHKFKINIEPESVEEVEDDDLPF